MTLSDKTPEDAGSLPPVESLTPLEPNKDRSEPLKRFSVSIPASLVDEFDTLVTDRHYPSRSEALRDIIRDYMVSTRWEASEQVVVGTVTLVYDHDQRSLGNALTSIQHEHHHEVLSTLHIHLDQHNCLEVIVLKGMASHLQEIADHLISSRGVKHGRLVCTTTGDEM